MVARLSMMMLVLATWSDAAASSCVHRMLDAYVRCGSSSCALEWATFPKSDFGATCARHVEGFVPTAEVATFLEQLAAASGRAHDGVYRIEIPFMAYSRLPETVQDFERSLVWFLGPREIAREPIADQVAQLDRETRCRWISRVAPSGDAVWLSAVRQSTDREARLATLWSWGHLAAVVASLLAMGIALAWALHAFYRWLFMAPRTSRIPVAPLLVPVAVALLALLLGSMADRAYFLHIAYIPIALFLTTAQLSSAIGHWLRRWRASTPNDAP